MIWSYGKFSLLELDITGLVLSSGFFDESLFLVQSLLRAIDLGVISFLAVSCHSVCINFKLFFSKIAIYTVHLPDLSAMHLVSLFCLLHTDWKNYYICNALTNCAKKTQCIVFDTFRLFAPTSSRYLSILGSLSYICSFPQFDEG